MEEFEIKNRREYGGVFVCKKTGLASYYISAWVILGMKLSDLSGLDLVEFHKCFWRSIPHYEDYLRSRLPNCKCIEEVIAKSDKVAVATVNALADEFNFHLPQMHADHDFGKAKEFYARAKELINPEKKREEK